MSTKLISDVLLFTVRKNALRKFSSRSHPKGRGRTVCSKLYKKSSVFGRVYALSYYIMLWKPLGNSQSTL